MDILTLILSYLPYIIIALVLIGGAIAYVINGKHSLKQWLIYGTIEAEKALGSGVGALKLRQVWENANRVMPFLMKFISFEKFSKLVDEALVEMRKLLESNKKIDEYVNEGKETE